MTRRICRQVRAGALLENTNIIMTPAAFVKHYFQKNVVSRDISCIRVSVSRVCQGEPSLFVIIRIYIEFRSISFRSIFTTKNRKILFFDESRVPESFHNSTFRSVRQEDDSFDALCSQSNASVDPIRTWFCCHISDLAACCQEKCPYCVPRDSSPICFPLCESFDNTPE